MKQEHRNGDRYSVNADLYLENELILLVGDRSVGIWKVRDISPFGMGLSIDKKVATGTEMTLEYRCESVEIRVFGVVVWSESESDEAEGGGYRVGVYFKADKMAMNMALCKVLTDTVAVIPEV
ncbi:MAG: PilZ domain-containing protein [Mariprofundus sp.]|nr:PilZ domain-containing protein [Mariprofundus sp.]